MNKLHYLVLFSLLASGLLAPFAAPLHADSSEIPHASGEAGVQFSPADDQSPTSISLSQVDMQATHSFLLLWLILSLLLGIATLVALHAVGSRTPQPVYSLSRVRWRLITWRFRLRQRWGKQLL